MGHILNIKVWESEKGILLNKDKDQRNSVGMLRQRTERNRQKYNGLSENWIVPMDLY